MPAIFNVWIAQPHKKRSTPYRPFDSYTHLSKLAILSEGRFLPHPCVLLAQGHYLPARTFTTQNASKGFTQAMQRTTF